MRTCKLILAEDEALVRQGILKLIDWDGLDLELAGECANGREAVAVFQSCGGADILLTDALMPEMDGLELARWVHANAPGCDVIFFSGHSEYDLLREAMRNHAADYLLKPVDRASLNHTLEAVVQRRRASAAGQGPKTKAALAKMVLCYAQGLIPFDECMQVFPGPVVAALVDAQAAPFFSEDAVLAAEAAEGLSVLFISAPEDSAEQLRHRLTMLLQEHCPLGRCGLSCPVPSFRELPRAYLQAQRARLEASEGEVRIFSDESQNAVALAVMEYIEQNYREPISLQSAAQRYSYHPSYISRVFKAQTGMSFTRYLTVKRIEMAEKMLRLNPDIRLADLAEQAGIPDLNYFCKIFKRQTGKTPHQYRTDLSASGPSAASETAPFPAQEP